MELGFKDVSITVSGNTGTGTFDLPVGAEIDAISIKAPSAAAAYDLSIVDVNSFPVYSMPGLVGNCLLDVEKSSHFTNTITLTGTNGAYSLRVRFRR